MTFDIFNVLTFHTIYVMLSYFDIFIRRNVFPRAEPQRITETISKRDLLMRKNQVNLFKDTEIMIKLSYHGNSV